MEWIFKGSVLDIKIYQCDDARLMFSIMNIFHSVLVSLKIVEIIFNQNVLNSFLSQVSIFLKNVYFLNVSFTNESHIDFNNVDFKNMNFYSLLIWVNWFCQKYKKYNSRNEFLHFSLFEEIVTFISIYLCLSHIRINSIIQSVAILSQDMFTILLP